MRYIFLILILMLASCTQIKVANESYDQGLYNDTISTCRKILQSDSTNADVYYLLGQSYSEIDSLDSAIVAYESAVFYQPDNKKFREKYYIAVVKRGEQWLPDDPKAALNYFEKAIRIDTTSYLAFEKSSDIHYNSGKYDLAVSGYRKALTLNGDSLRLETKLSKIDSVANSAEHYLMNGKAALDNKKYDDAKTYFRKALDQKPDYDEAKYQLYIATGLRLYQKGSENALWDALDNFGRASFVFPERGEPHYYSGLAYNKKDKSEYSNAIEALEKSITIEPNGKWAKAARQEVDKIRERKKKMDAFYGR